MPCKKCDLHFTSYCVDCAFAKTGLNLCEKEYQELLKTRNEQERYEH